MQNKGTDKKKKKLLKGLKWISVVGFENLFV